MTPESPFFRHNFHHIQDSPLYSTTTYHFLTNIGNYLDLLETERSIYLKGEDTLAVLSRQLRLRRRIIAHRQLDPKNYGKDHNRGYESVRLICIALLHLSDTCLPIFIAFRAPGTFS